MKKTSLYRLYDENETLLYVGISNNWFNRFQTHYKEKSWIEETSRINVEWFPSRRKAELAERTAIRWELPKYNKQSVISDSNSWKHFQSIRFPEGLDNFHQKLWEKIDGFVNEAWALDCSFGNIVEWAVSNALFELSAVEDEVLVSCEQCTILANKWWLNEGHEIVCSTYAKGII